MPIYQIREGQLCETKLIQEKFGVFSNKNILMEGRQMFHGKNERIYLQSWHSVTWLEEKIRPQQQEQQLAFTYNLWQGNIEAGSLRSCPNGFSPKLKKKSCHM